MKTSAKPKQKTSSKARATKSGKKETPKVVSLNAAQMRQFMASMIDQANDGDTLSDAQDIIYQAWDASSKKKRVELARKALSVSSDCADAYVLLAQESAKTLQEKCDLFAEGVEAGERAIGSDDFEDFKGSFWGFLETRPYMRARLGLAEALWEMGKEAEAIQHYCALLELNPNDNQGVRFILSSRYLHSGKDAELKKLLKSYHKDSSAAWLYTWALMAFRTKDKSAEEIAKKAWKYNQHVPAMLAGTKALASSDTGYMTMGGTDEATYYVEECGDVWRKTPKAVEWLLGVTKTLSAASQK